MREHIIRERHELSAVSTCLHVTWSCQLLSSASKLLALEHPSRLQIPAGAEKCMCSIQKLTPAWYITYVLISILISKSMPFPKSRVGRVLVSDGARSQRQLHSSRCGPVQCGAHASSTKIVFFQSRTACACLEFRLAQSTDYHVFMAVIRRALRSFKTVKGFGKRSATPHSAQNNMTQRVPRPPTKK